MQDSISSRSNQPEVSNSPRFIHLKGQDKKLCATIAYIATGRTEDSEVYYGTLVVSPDEKFHLVSYGTARARAGARCVQAREKDCQIGWKPYIRNGLPDALKRNERVSFVEHLGLCKLGKMPRHTFERIVEQLREKMRGEE